jgi:hypothetical protein
MRIALVGGLSRHEAALVRRAHESGHSLEFHPGDVGGTGALELEMICERAELVVIVTSVNSHGAVGIAKKTVRRLGRASLFLRSCGLARFQLLLDALRAPAWRPEMSASVGG